VLFVCSNNAGRSATTLAHLQYLIGEQITIGFGLSDRVKVSPIAAWFCRRVTVVSAV